MGPESTCTNGRKGSFAGLIYRVPLFSQPVNCTREKTFYISYTHFLVLSLTKEDPICPVSFVSFKLNCISVLCHSSALSYGAIQTARSLGTLRVVSFLLTCVCSHVGPGPCLFPGDPFVLPGGESKKLAPFLSFQDMVFVYVHLYQCIS